ncbi:unnamed protein product [Rangifer tarandus platyrhynchus]|uniref:Uncharacterized protein n=1 Tax=Rangifer tarandus platyrhynchus TaxID=3082113 RepID=A0AC59YJW5_RANTA
MEMKENKSGSAVSDGDSAHSGTGQVPARKPCESRRTSNLRLVLEILTVCEGFTLLQPAGSPRWKRSVSVLSSVTAIQEVPTRPASSSKAAERVLPGAGECAASEEDLPRRPE